MLCNKCGKAFDDEKACPFCGTRIIKIGADKRKKEEVLKSPFVAAKVEDSKESESDAAQDAKAEAKTEAEVEAPKDAKAGAPAEAAKEAKTEVKAKTKAKNEVKTKTKAKNEVKTKTKVKIQAESEANSKSESVNVQETKANVDADRSVAGPFVTDATATGSVAAVAVIAEAVNPDEEKVKNAPEDIKPEMTDNFENANLSTDDNASDGDYAEEEFTPVLGAFVPTGVTPKPSVPADKADSSMENKAKKPTKSKLMTLGVIGAVSVVLIVGGVVVTSIALKNSKYNKAMNSFNNHDYDASYEMFSSLDSFKDSDFWTQYSKSEQDIQGIESLEAEHRFAAIIEIYTNRANFLGSTEEGIEASKLSIEYNIVSRAFMNKDAKKYGTAKADFDSLVLLREKYKEQILICEALDCIKDEWWEDAVVCLYAIKIDDYELSFLENPKNEEEELIAAFYNDNYIDYDKIDTIAEVIKPANADQQEVYDILFKNLEYDKASYLLNQKQYESAKEIFEELGDFADSAERSAECDEMLASVAEQYELAKSIYDNGEYYSAKLAWEACGDYKDSAEMAASCVQKMPESGSMSVSPDGPNPLYIYAPSDSSLLFRVYDSDGNLVAQVFVGAGEKETLNLYQGQYIMKAAFGTEWFGEKDMFGEAGVYRKVLYNGSDSIAMAYPYNLTVDFSDGPNSVTGTQISDGAAGM